MRNDLTAVEMRPAMERTLKERFDADKVEDLVQLINDIHAALQL